MVPTLADILRLDVVRRGQPDVVAGADRLDVRVRWVHVIEILHAAHLLRGGELVLITGVALPDEAEKLRRYVAELAEVGVSGLAVELGHKYQRDLPDVLVGAAEAHHLPLITLRAETPFIAITEAVHGMIIDAQLAELRTAQHLHEVFTELSVEGAEPDAVISEVAKLSGRPAVLENLAHQVLACESPGRDPGELLDDWETRSRGVGGDERTHYDDAAGWLVTMVGARGEDWGRLILVSGERPEASDVVLVERAATTLALGRLLEHRQASLERQTHHTIIAGIRTHAYTDPAEVAARARAVGVPLSGRRLIAAALRLRDAGSGLAAQARLSDTAEIVAAACREVRLPALVGVLDDVGPGLLLALPEHSAVDAALHMLAEQLRARLKERFVLGVGSTVDQVRDVGRSFTEAEQVAAAAARTDGTRVVYRLHDLRLRGLLHLLRDDSRLQVFVERELGPLLTYDAQHDTQLVRLLGVYLDAGRNKAAAAARAHLSRPAFYERLGKIERILGVDVDSIDSALSLHVALLARELIRGAA